MPMIVERRAEVENLQHDLQGRCYDLEYSLRYFTHRTHFERISWIFFFQAYLCFSALFVSAIKAIDKSTEPFQNIQELLKTAIFLKQQLKVEEAKRRPNPPTNQNASVYKRLSGVYCVCGGEIILFKFNENCIFVAHIQTTLDFPDLDFSGTIRETTARMENMMSTTRNGSQNPVSTSSRTSSSSNVSVSSEVMQRSHTTLHWNATKFVIVNFKLIYLHSKWLLLLLNSS